MSRQSGNWAGFEGRTRHVPGRGQCSDRIIRSLDDEAGNAFRENAGQGQGAGCDCASCSQCCCEARALAGSSEACAALVKVFSNYSFGLRARCRRQVARGLVDSGWELLAFVCLGMVAFTEAACSNNDVSGVECSMGTTFVNNQGFRVSAGLCTGDEQR